MNMETPDWEWVEGKMEIGPWDVLSVADQEALSPWYDAESFNRERALLSFAQKGFLQDKATIVPPLEVGVKKQKLSWSWWPWMGVAAACLAGVWWWLASPDQGTELAYEVQHQVAAEMPPIPVDEPEGTKTNEEKLQTMRSWSETEQEEAVTDVLLMEQDRAVAHEEPMQPSAAEMRKSSPPSTPTTAHLDAEVMENEAVSKTYHQVSATISTGAPLPSGTGMSASYRFFPPKTWTMKDTLRRADTLFVRFSRKGQSDTLIPAHQLKR
jgi:hypothetical protein